MSTPEDFTGPGYLAGESPEGLTTVAGVPVPAQVQVLWRDSADPTGTETLVAQTASDAGGQWRITNLNPDLQYVVRGRKAGFDDVTIVGAVPTRTDAITASGSFTTDPDTESIAGQAVVEGGLPPYTFTRVDTALTGVEASFSGRFVGLSGFDYLPPAQPYQFAVRVQSSNGLDEEVLLPIYAGLGTPQAMRVSPVILFAPTYIDLVPKVLFGPLHFAAELHADPEDKGKNYIFRPTFLTAVRKFLFAPLNFHLQLQTSENDVFIKLTWKDPSAFGNAFKIYRDTSPIDPDNLPAEPYALVDAATGPAPQDMEWFDTGVVEGQTYHYAVESYFGDESKITASKSLAAVPIPTEIGEYFYGGYYVGNITTGGSTYAVIFAVEEADVLRQWKTASTGTPDTLSDTDGWANTLAMTADGTLAAAHPAAAYCRAYAGAGFDDWYLPARSELLLPWTNRADLADLNMGKDTGYVWSSTQHPSAATSAWHRRFSDGSENNLYKTGSYRVRPCRRLKLSI